MIDALSFLRIPLEFYDICKVYPPTIREVLSNSSFNTYLKILTITQEELEAEFNKNQKQDSAEKPPTPLEFLLSCAYNSADFRERSIQAFEFFTKEKVLYLYENKKVLVGDLAKIGPNISVEQLKFLDEDNYFEFQNLVRKATGLKPAKPPVLDDPNEDPRITAIKKKARARDAIKAKQGGKNGLTLDTCLVAICCMGIGITPLNIGEMSYAAIEPIMNMMQEKEKYDIDIRSLLAGADSKKIKPKYWIRNSDKDE